MVDLFVVMKKLLLACFVFASVISIGAAATEQEIVDRSANILRGFRAMPEQGIPAGVFRNAKVLRFCRWSKSGSA